MKAAPTAILSLFLALILFFQSYADDQIQFVSETAPAVEVQASTDLITLKIKTGQHEVWLHKSDVSSEALKNFAELSQMDQSKFLENRQNVLTLFAKIVYYPSLMAGFGVVTKKNITQYFKGHLNQSNIKSGPEESQVVRENLLKFVEASLWKNIRLVRESNEYGVHFDLGIITEFGTLSKGKGGAGSLYFNISYNPQQKALAFEIGIEREKYLRSVPGMANFAIFWKAFPYIAHVDTSRIQGTMTGKAYYPPGIFGSTAIDNIFYGVGYTDSPLGIPSFLGSLMYYENEMKRTALVKISFSPLIKGYFKFQSALTEYFYFGSSPSMACAKAFH